LAAVYSIIACVTVPFFMFIVPRIYESLHPDPLLNSQGKIQMSSRMQHVFFSSMIGFTVLFYWMLRLKVESLSIKRIVEVESINE